MGMPDPDQYVQQQPYEYQFPVELVHQPERDPKHKLVDWLVTTFGATPVLVATGIGLYVMATRILEKWGVRRALNDTKPRKPEE